MVVPLLPQRRCNVKASSRLSCRWPAWWRQTSARWNMQCGQQTPVSRREDDEEQSPEGTEACDCTTRGCQRCAVCCWRVLVCVQACTHTKTLIKPISFHFHSFSHDVELVSKTTDIFKFIALCYWSEEMYTWIYATWLYGCYVRTKNFTVYDASLTCSQTCADYIWIHRHQRSCA